MLRGLSILRRGERHPGFTPQRGMMTCQVRIAVWYHAQHRTLDSMLSAAALLLSVADTCISPAVNIFRPRKWHAS